MSQEQIKGVIEQVLNFCLNQDAVGFASLFSEDAELILNKNLTFFKSDIEPVTRDYFSQLKYIKIDIKSIGIEDNKAFIEWTWEDFNLQTWQKNCHDNVISLRFKSGLISSWKEYKFN